MPKYNWPEEHKTMSRVLCSISISVTPSPTPTKLRKKLSELEIENFNESTLHLSHVRFESRPLPRCPIPIPPPLAFHNSLYPRPRFLITFSKNEKSDLQGDFILLTKFEPIDKGLKGRSGIGRSFNLSHIRVDPPRYFCWLGWLL